MTKNRPKRVKTLFSEFDSNTAYNSRSTGKLCFEGVEGLDVYNITAPFFSAGHRLIAGRVEPRDQEFSTVVIFELSGDTWAPLAGAPRYQMQDPFVTMIQGELILGGVEIEDNAGQLTWRTVFYRGANIFCLTRFLTGPEGMKDIRLCDLGKKGIGVFTRPQGGVGGRGKIGYFKVASLEALSSERIASAPLIDGMFDDLDWGGVNEAHPLGDGLIGLLAHVAYFVDDDTAGERKYYAASFTFDPERMIFNDLKIIACRRQFIDGDAKRPDLYDVIFPSGLIEENNSMILYAGVSDAEAHWLEIPAPFAAW